MKLYTEEQIRKFLTTKQSFITLDDMLNLEYIQLPSDMEIYEEASDWVFRKNSTKWSVNDDTAGDNMGSFLNGARWMRDKIGGNK